MKIVMIGQKGVPSKVGGVENHVAALSARLVRTGHSVVAYGRHWYSGRSRVYDGIRVVGLPSIHTKHFDTISHTLLATLHACLFVRPDVYHFHGVGPSLLAWIPRILSPHAAVITTFHSIDREHGKWGMFAKFVLKLGERACMTFADETIAVSKTLASYAVREYGKRPTCIPNGITPQRFATDPLLLEPFGLRPFAYIAMVSRLVPHKGAHTLIEAWKKARAKNLDVLRDIKLAIVGDSSFTDAYVRSLHALAGDDRSIVFTGNQTGETLASLFGGARFVVHPSASEGLPICVLEAMSFGKAVVASDIPENMEVLRDYGVPFSLGDGDELAEKIVELAADPTRAASLGHLARTFVEDAYDWDDIAGDVLRVYRANSELRDGVLAVR